MTTTLSQSSVAKAERMWRAGKVVESRGKRLFTVEGDHGSYVVALDEEDGELTCTCPAYHLCSHMAAVGLLLRAEGVSGARRPGNLKPVPQDFVANVVATDMLPAGGRTTSSGGVRPSATPTHEARHRANGPGLGHEGEGSVTPTDSTGRPRLMTWHFRAALDANPPDVVLVRTSIGKPKWISPHLADALPFIKELAPYGMFDEKDDAVFERKYRARLDGFGVDRLERRFAQLIEANDGMPLVLLCYEKDRSECHRSMFARWWEEKTGEHVPEYTPRAIAHDEPAPDPEPPAQGELL